MAFKRRHKIYSLTLNYKGTPLQFKVRAVHVSAVQCEFYWESPEPESRHYRLATGRVTNVKDRDAMIYCLHHNLELIWSTRVNYITQLIRGVMVEKPVIPSFEWVFPKDNKIYSSSYATLKMLDSVFEWAVLNTRSMELADISMDYGV